MPELNNLVNCYECDRSLDRHTDDVYRVEGRWLCEDCVNHCQNCGTEVLPGYSLCDSCAEARVNENESAVIYDYHEGDPTALGWWRKGQKHDRPNRADKTRYFGLELEFDIARGAWAARDSLAQKCLDTFQGKALAEEDGSLGEGGFEIVSAPMDYDTMHKTIEALDLPSELHANKSCGLHIHVSRRSLSPLTIGKLLVFVHDCKNSDLVSRMARREPTYYCERPAKKLTPAEIYGHNRYQAINTVNNYTIEFRLFRSAKTTWRILASLEAVQALIEWCEQTSIRDLTGQGFETFVAKHQGQYPNLVRLLDSVSYASWAKVRTQFPKKVVPAKYRVPVGANYNLEIASEEAA